MEQATVGVIGPQQLAYLRAQVHAQRAVTTRDAAILLEAYDEVVRRLEAVTVELNDRVSAAAVA